MPDDNAPLQELEALPEAYADWRRSTLGRITDGLEERLLRELIGKVSGRRILDVGCGDGVLATRLAKAGARVTGLDASGHMLAAARDRAATAGVDLHLVQGDAGRLPFPNAHFDTVVSVATLCFYEQPYGPVGEMARVLKPGGRLVLGNLGGCNTWAALRRVKGWLGSDLWRAAHFRSRGDLIALAARAGLRDAHISGAIFYPPVGAAARLMAPLDAAIGRWTTAGAAFLVLSATRPAIPAFSKETA